MNNNLLLILILVSILIVFIVLLKHISKKEYFTDIFGDGKCNFIEDNNDLFNRCKDDNYFLTKNYDATNFETVKQTKVNNITECLEYCNYQQGNDGNTDNIEADYSLYIKNKIPVENSDDDNNCYCYKTKNNSIPEIVQKTYSQQGVLMGLLNYFELKGNQEVFIRCSNGNYLYVEYGDMDTMKNYNYTQEQFLMEINAGMFTWVDNKYMPFFLLKSKKVSDWNDIDDTERQQFLFVIKKVSSDGLDSKYIIIPKQYKGDTNTSSNYVNYVENTIETSYEDLRINFTAGAEKDPKNYYTYRNYKVDWASIDNNSNNFYYFNIRPSIFKQHALKNMVNIVSTKAQKYLSCRPYALSPIQAFSTWITYYVKYYIDHIYSNYSTVEMGKALIYTSVDQLDVVTNFGGTSDKFRFTKKEDDFVTRMNEINPNYVSNYNTNDINNISKPITEIEQSTLFSMVYDFIITNNVLVFTKDNDNNVCGINDDTLYTGCPFGSTTINYYVIEIDKYSSDVTFTNTTDTFLESDFACGENMSFKFYNSRAINSELNEDLDIDNAVLTDDQIKISDSITDEITIKDYKTPEDTNVKESDYWRVYTDTAYGWSDINNINTCAPWIDTSTTKQECTTKSNISALDIFIPIALIIDAAEGNLETTTCEDVKVESGYYKKDDCVHNVKKNTSKYELYRQICKSKYGNNADPYNISDDIGETGSVYAITGDLANKSPDKYKISLGGETFPVTGDNEYRVACKYTLS